MRKRIAFGSFLILILTIISIIMFLLEGGIILKTTSQLLNNNLNKNYRAWDAIFGYTQENEQIIERSIWGIIGFIALILGGISPLLRPLSAYRFLLSFLLLTTSTVLTYLLQYNTNLATLDWGDLLTISPTLGTPITIAIILQAISAIISLYLFFIALKNYD